MQSGVLRRTARAVVFSLAVVVLAATSPAAVFDEQIDQSHQTNSNSAYGITSNQDWGQIFTVGQLGRITRIDLQIVREAGVTQPLNIQLRRASGDAPDLTALALMFSTSVNAADVPLAPGTTVFPLSIDLSAAEVDVEPGEKFAILCSTQNLSSTGWYLWASDKTNTYAGGNALHRFTFQGPNYTVRLNDDSGFRTWMIPEPTGSLPLCVALLTIARRRRQS